MKVVQYFSEEYLDRCRQMTSEQIVRFLEDFRLIHKPVRKSETRLISIKIETDLLEVFKTQSRLDGVPYQTRIKQIMRDWLKTENKKSKTA